jgi:outer membrane protein OmpA-like peptidoglycan-associated protein
MEGLYPRRAITAAEGMESEGALHHHQHRLLGEDAPIWLPLGFAVVGTLIAIASAWAWLAASSPSTAMRPVVAASPAPERSRSVDHGGIAQRLRPAESLRPPETREDAAVVTPSAPERETPLQASPQVDLPAQQFERNAASPPPICFTAFNIPFAYDSSTPIIKDLEPEIESLRRWMLDHPNAILLIEGHTDTTGTEQYNIVLSFARAKAVASLLAHLGVPERRLTVRAAGAIAATDKGGEVARNRRALLRVEGVENCSGETEKQ